MAHGVVLLFVNILSGSAQETKLSTHKFLCAH